METTNQDIRNLATVSSVKNFLMEQRKTFRNVIARLPHGQRCGTPEGIQNQVDEADRWPLDLTFYQIHSATEEPLTVNLTIRRISVSKADAAAV